MSWANIPRAEYEKFAPQFNPVKFDAASGSRTAKDAGMKYIVITTKHHDGFALFDSAVSDYDDRRSARRARKDPMAALAAEAKKAGLKFCFYYSIMDWHHPATTSTRRARIGRRATTRRQIIPDQKAAYVSYMKAQLKELITKYDPAVLWFDGEWKDWWTEADGQDLYDYVRELEARHHHQQPRRHGPEGHGRPQQDGPHVRRRLRHARAGDSRQRPPGRRLGNLHDDERHWGFKSDDTNWKSTETLVRNLVDIASKGGNYLLNVGPTAEGEIPAA